MNLIIDILGALVIGSMLMLMMITFQYQLKDTADAAIFMAGMVDHMQKSTTKLNELISFAGIGMTPTTTITTAGTTRLAFRTKWDYTTNTISATIHTINLELADSTAVGRSLLVKQDNVVLDKMSYIQWVDQLGFRYFDIDDHVTTTPASVRSIEYRITFRHHAPSMGAEPLHTRLQMRCYLMNAYLAGG